MIKVYSYPEEGDKTQGVGVDSRTGSPTGLSSSSL